MFILFTHFYYKNMNLTSINEMVYGLSFNFIACIIQKTTVHVPHNHSFTYTQQLECLLIQYSPVLLLGNYSFYLFIASLYNNKLHVHAFICESRCMKVKLNYYCLNFKESVSQVSDHSVDIRLRRLFSLF